MGYAWAVVENRPKPIKIVKMAKTISFLAKNHAKSRLNKFRMRAAR